MDISSPEYKLAFEQYLRKGTAIDLSLKNVRATTHYIWRTRSDGKVRSSHAVNDGKIFAWDNPPPTGHPGEDYGCRCVAEPYAPMVSEDFDFEFTNVSDTGSTWDTLDFVNHYFFGNGQAVTVRQTGHLTAIVQQYRHIVIDDPKRLPAQIADVARKNPNSSFSDTFEKSYNMTNVVFSIGNTKIIGDFRGSCEEIGGMLHLSGTANFQLQDKFEDPLDIGDYLPEEYANIDEEIVSAILDIMSKIGAASASVIDLAEEVTNRVAAGFSYVDRRLRDYIYNRALRQLRKNKSATFDLYTKDLREIPGSTIYGIVDDWGGVFTARVISDKSKS